MKIHTYIHTDAIYNGACMLCDGCCRTRAAGVSTDPWMYIDRKVTAACTKSVRLSDRLTDICTATAACARAHPSAGRERNVERPRWYASLGSNQHV